MGFRGGRSCQRWMAVFQGKQLQDGTAGRDGAGARAVRRDRADGLGPVLLRTSSGRRNGCRRSLDESGGVGLVAGSPQPRRGSRRRRPCGWAIALQPVAQSGPRGQRGGGQRGGARVRDDPSPYCAGPSGPDRQWANARRLHGAGQGAPAELVAGGFGHWRAGHFGCCVGAAGGPCASV